MGHHTDPPLLAPISPAGFETEAKNAYRIGCAALGEWMAATASAIATERPFTPIISQKEPQLSGSLTLLEYNRCFREAVNNRFAKSKDGQGGGLHEAVLAAPGFQGLIDKMAAADVFAILAGAILLTDSPLRSPSKAHAATALAFTLVAGAPLTSSLPVMREAVLSRTALLVDDTFSADTLKDVLSFVLSRKILNAASAASGFDSLNHKRLERRDLEGNPRKKELVAGLATVLSDAILDLNDNPGREKAARIMSAISSLFTTLDKELALTPCENLFPGFDPTPPSEGAPLDRLLTLVSALTESFPETPLHRPRSSDRNRP